MFNYTIQRMVYQASLTHYLKTETMLSFDGAAEALGIQSPPDKAATKSDVFHLDLEDYLAGLIQMSAQEWLDFADGIKGMIVTNPGRKPAAIRVDQVDREQDDPSVVKYPELVHSGTRPPQMCFAGNPEYQKAYREFVKFRHLLANMAKPSYKDKRKLEALETKLTELRNTAKLKRDVTVAVSSQVSTNRP